MIDQIQNSIVRRDYKYALYLCEKSEPQSNYDKALIFSLMGRCYWFLGKYKKAEHYLSEAVKYFRELEITNKTCETLIDLGMVYDALPDYERAIFTFNEAYNISKEIGSKHLQAVSMGSLGLIHARQRNHIKALETLNLSYDYFAEADVPSVFSEFLSRSIPSLISIGDMDSAYHNANKALMLAIDSHNQGKIAGAYRALGQCSVAQDKWEEGISFFEAAVEIFEVINSEVELARTYYEYALLLKALYNLVGDVNVKTKALDILSKAHVIYSNRKYHRRKKMVMGLIESIS